MKYQDWQQLVPKELTADPLWKIEAYRLGLFIADVCWRDVTKLVRDERLTGLSDQLYRAVCAISASIAVGYSRGAGRERARFYEYALASAREARGWYYGGRHVLGEHVISHRLGLLTQIVRLLLVMIPQQRGRLMYEQNGAYQPIPDPLTPTVSTTPMAVAKSATDIEILEALLRDVPLP
jgi:four helix bundle protein